MKFSPIIRLLLIHYKLALSFQHDIYIYTIYICICCTPRTFSLLHHTSCHANPAPCAAGFSMDVEPQWVASPDSIFSIFLDILTVQGGPLPVITGVITPTSRVKKPQLPSYPFIGAPSIYHNRRRPPCQLQNINALKTCAPFPCWFSWYLPEVEQWLLVAKPHFLGWLDSDGSDFCIRSASQCLGNWWNVVKHSSWPWSQNCATFEAAQQESQNNFQTFVKCVKTKVFVMEVVVKLLLLSPRVYFTGTNYAWNIGATWAGILNPPSILDPNG